MISWHQGEVSVVVECVGGPQTVAGTVAVFTLNSPNTGGWRIKGRDGSPHHAPQTVTTVKGRRQLQDRWTE